ncbi:hypothetical protein IJG66_01685 [Candidatus Saccharibacteria bacterium]|nr:hypothetical protein [Candidatus Saccharibacteria bacterium]
MRKLNKLSNSLIAITAAFALFGTSVYAMEPDAVSADVIAGEPTMSAEGSVSADTPSEVISPAEEPVATEEPEEPMMEQPSAEDVVPAPEPEPVAAEPEPEVAAEAEVISADVVSSDVVFAEDIAAQAAVEVTASDDNANFDGIVVDGKPGSERLMSSGITNSAKVMTDGAQIASFGTGKNAEYSFSYDASYIWVVEKKGYTFKCRVPYWFMNAYPKAAFYIGKGKKKVSIPVYNTSGKKVVTKTVTLNTDSQLWLGNYADDDNIVCPPWLAKAFNNAVKEGISSTDSACLITYLPVYKNAKALKAGKWTLTRKIEYYNFGKYRITTIVPTAENPGGDFEIGF